AVLLNRYECHRRSWQWHADLKLSTAGTERDGQLLILILPGMYGAIRSQLVEHCRDIRGKYVFWPFPFAPGELEECFMQGPGTIESLQWLGILADGSAYLRCGESFDQAAEPACMTSNGALDV